MKTTLSWLKSHLDTDAPIALKALETEPSGTIKSVSLTRRPELAVVRLKLERPRLASAAIDGSAWTIMLGSEGIEPPSALAISRNTGAPLWSLHCCSHAPMARRSVPFNNRRRLLLGCRRLPQ